MTGHRTRSRTLSIQHPAGCSSYHMSFPIRRRDPLKKCLCCSQPCRVSDDRSCTCRLKIVLFTDALTRFLPQVSHLQYYLIMICFHATIFNFLEVEFMYDAGQQADTNACSFNACTMHTHAVGTFDHVQESMNCRPHERPCFYAK